MAQCRHAVFGSGNSLYEENYNAAAHRLDGLLRRLRSRPLCATGIADDNVARPDQGSAEGDFEQWLQVRAVRCCACALCAVLCVVRRCVCALCVFLVRCGAVCVRCVLFLCVLPLSHL